MAALVLLVGKGALSGAVVTGILVAARRGNAQLAGLLVSAPVVTVLTVFFVGWDGGTGDTHRFAGFTALGVAVYVIFPLSLWLLARRARWQLSLLGATTAWLAATAIFLAATAGS